MGGGLITVVLGAYVVHLMSTPYLACPVQANDVGLFLRGEAPLFEVTECSLDSSFKIRDFNVRNNRQKMSVLTVLP